MTVDQLACFLAVAENGTFTQAAEKLYISHSAVSKAISSMEANFGVKLLNRDNRSVSLTPAGEILAERGKHLYRLWLDLEERVSKVENERYGTITIASPFLGDKGIFAICQLMSEKYPLVQQVFHSAEHPTSIYQSIANGHFDLGFTFSFAVPEEQELIAKMPILKDHFCCAVSTRHKFATRESVDIKELMDEPMVFPPHYANKDIEELRPVHRSAQPGDCITQTFEECLVQTSLGRGVAILPSVAVGSGYPCKCIPIDDLDVEFNLLLLWRTDRMSPAINAFLEIAHDNGIAANKSG